MLPSSTDVVIVGGGVAGLRAALEAARTRRVLLVNKERGNKSNSAYAQGGIAVALEGRAERDAHFLDTIRTGRGLCRPAAVRILVDEGPRRVRELIRWGVRFDREGRGFAKAHEGAHTRRRILRAGGDRIGMEMTTVLSRLVESHSRIRVAAGVFSVDVCVEDGRCAGLWVLDRGRLRLIRAGAVILATGGIGQAYWRTTNPLVATGDGVAMACRAGAVLADLEFVQFHPTALAVKGAPSFLLSEAMRGEGAILRTRAGAAFMERYDARRELAPRDVVARAIWREMAASNDDHVLLDVTAMPRRWLWERFPLIAKTCRRYGIDIATMPIPVAPAAHFMIGGVKTDVRGATSLPGLFAVGETACTGVHGANRLASNSLLEGLVFGARTGAAAASAARLPMDRPITTVSVRAPGPAPSAARLAEVRSTIRKVMWEGVGIERTASSLRGALAELERAERVNRIGSKSRDVLEVQNLLLVATVVARSALKRRGSVGCHFRRDCPQRGAHWRRHITVTCGRGRATRSRGVR